MATFNYPDGFYGAEAPENTYFWDGPSSNFTNEMDFNRFIYFFSDDGRMLLRSEIDLDILRSVVSRPHGGPWLPQLDKLMTLDNNAVKRPAHLPNIMDIFGLPEVQLAIDNTKVGEDADDEDQYGDVPTPLFPIHLADKADAKPVLPLKGPVYWFGNRTFTSKLAFNADAFQLLEITSNLSAVNIDIIHKPLVDDYLNSRCYTVSLSPTISISSRPTLDLGSIIIHWNARRITRPSFETNFHQYVGMFNPAVIILTEVRVFTICCERVLNNLETSMSWWLDGGVGLMGGTLVLWDPTRVSVQMAVDPESDPYGGGKRRVTGTIQAVDGGASVNVDGGGSVSVAGAGQA